MAGSPSNLVDLRLALIDGWTPLNAMLSKIEQQFSPGVLGYEMNLDGSVPEGTSVEYRRAAGIFVDVHHCAKSAALHANLLFFKKSLKPDAVIAEVGDLVDKYIAEMRAVETKYGYNLEEFISVGLSQKELIIRCKSNLHQIGLR